jgi:hypothetical protein
MTRLTLGLTLTAFLLLAPTPRTLAGERSIEAMGSGFLDAASYYPEIRGPGEGDHLGRCGLFLALDAESLAYEGDLVPVALRLYSASDDNLNAAVTASQSDPNTGILAVSLTFTGGTGRFADASGTADLLILFDDWQGPYTGSRLTWGLVGTIDY